MMGHEAAGGRRAMAPAGLAVLVVLGLLVVPSASQAKTYAYKPLEPVAVSSADAQRLDEILVPILAKYVHGPIRTLDSIRSKRQRRKIAPLLVCGAELNCAVRFGQSLGVDYVITGDVAPVGRAYAVTLKLLHVASKSAKARASAVLPRSVHPGDLAVEQLVVRLVAPDKYVGVLKIQVDVNGARVFVDGKLLGTSPLGPVTLPCGAHAVRVTHPAYHDFVRFARIQYKKTTTLKANMKAYPIFSATLGAKKKQVTIVTGKKPKIIYRPLPWYRRWYTVTAIAAGVAILAGVVTAVVLANTGGTNVNADGTTPL